MKKIVCSSLKSLLHLLCSGMLARGDKVNFLVLKNSWMAEEDKSQSIKSENFAKELCDYFGVKLVFWGTYEFYLPGKIVGETKKIKLPEVPISLEDGDMVTQGCLLYLRSNCKNKKLEIFPEGNSCLNSIVNPLPLSVGDFRYCLTNFQRWKTRLLVPFYLRLQLLDIHRKLRLNKFFRRPEPYIIKKFVLPDIHGAVDDIKRKRSFNAKIEVLDRHVFDKNYKYAATHFAGNHPSLDFRDRPESLGFFPVDKVIEEQDLVVYAGRLREHLGGSCVVAKKHPTDKRGLEQLPNLKDFEWIPDAYRSVPIELFLFQKNFRYFGFLSTALLNVNLNRALLLEPIERKDIDFYKHGPTWAHYRLVFKMLKGKYQGFS